MIQRLSVRTPSRAALVDVTSRVAEIVRGTGISDGTAFLYIPHTTCGLTIQENADPPLKQDLTAALDRLFPWPGPYRHGEDNAAAHMKSMLTGPS